MSSKHNTKLDLMIDSRYFACYGELVERNAKSKECWTKGWSTIGFTCPKYARPLQLNMSNRSDHATNHKGVLG